MNKDKRNNIKLLGTLNNSDERGIIANANQIYDANEDKSTQDVSKEHTERIKSLETKESSMQTTLENITKTGEASAASNVTYNHSDSRLDATNVQQAVDEVRKRSNYNDGDNIIDFNTIHLIKDSEVWFLLLVDANDKFVFGISRKDGQPYWGVGVPKVIKDYVDKQINDILGTDNITETIDSLKEVEDFLADFKNSDTLKALLDTKANKVDVDAAIANTTADIADKYKKSNPNDEEGNVVGTNTLLGVKGNAPFFSIVTDLVGKVLEMIDLHGVHKFFAGIDIQGSLHFVTTNHKFIWMLVDSEDKFILGIDKETGSPIYGVDVPIQIKEYIDNAISNISTDILKQVNEVIARSFDKITIANGVGGILFTDSDGKVLFTLGLNNENKSFLPLNVQGSSFRVMTNEHFFFVLLDNDDKAVFYIDREGNVNWQRGVPQVIKDYVISLINELKENINSYDSNDIVERNRNRISALYAACKQDHSTKDVQLQIVTDTHENPLSIQNGVKIANNFDSIDAIIHCGDIAISDGGKDRSYVIERMKDLAKSSKPWFFVAGNHDGGQNENIAYNLTPEQEYETYFKPLIESGNLRDGEYQEGKNYWYHDFKDTKYNMPIRLIGIFEYEGPTDVADNDYWEPVEYNSSYPQIQMYHTYSYSANNDIYVNCGYYTEHSFKLKADVTTAGSGATVPHYKIPRGVRLIREEQAKWFINTLLSTPEGYGIVVAMHNPFSGNSTNQKQYNFADESITENAEPQSAMVDDFFANIINAYINRESITEKVIVASAIWSGNGSYLNTLDDGDGVKYYYKVDADFTNAKATFCSFIGGHVHTDIILKHNKYNLYGINPTSGVIDKWSKVDTARTRKDNLAHDAITCLSWTTNEIRLARIGNLYSKFGKKRDIEIINKLNS